MSCRPTQCRYLSRATSVVLTLGPEGEIRTADPRRSPLGYRSHDLAGRSLAELVAEGEENHLRRVLERCHSGQPVWDDLTLETADGGTVELLCCFQPMPEGAESPGALLLTGLARDGLETKARLRAAALMGHLSFRCHRPAHRLMQTFEALLTDDDTAGPAASGREDLDALLEAMSEATVWPWAERQGQAVDLVRVLEETVRRIDEDPSLEGLNVRLRPDAAALWTSAPPVGLACVTLHLAANAREAAPDGEVNLSIDVHRRDGRIEVEFTDDGPGLTRREAAEAIDPGFAACAAGAHGGLGLTTCAELAWHMGGHLRVCGRRSQGTTVVLTVPAATPPH